jgi:hypothetical protein
MRYETLRSVTQRARTHKHHHTRENVTPSMNTRTGHRIEAGRGAYRWGGSRGTRWWHSAHSFKCQGISVCAFGTVPTLSCTRRWATDVISRCAARARSRRASRSLKSDTDKEPRIRDSQGRMAFKYRHSRPAGAASVQELGSQELPAWRTALELFHLPGGLLLSMDPGVVRWLRSTAQQQTMVVAGEPFRRA